MKRKIAMLALSSVIAAGSVAALRVSTDLEPAAPSLKSLRDHAARIERGHYLVRTSGCHDCHTPWKLGPNGPEPDMDLMLSGHPAELELPPPPEGVGPWIWHGSATNTAFAGPWGTSYTANLTSDELTGIGAWTEDIFIGAIRTGRHWGQSRPILPPMPRQVYGQMTDEDLGAIFAYLKSVPPIRNQVPEPVLAGAAPSTSTL